MEKFLLKDTIESDSILLRKHRMSDAGKIFESIDKDRARLTKFLPWPPAIKTVQDEANYIDYTHKAWEQHRLFDYSIFYNPGEVFVGCRRGAGLLDRRRVRGQRTGLQGCRRFGCLSVRGRFFPAGGAVHGGQLPELPSG